MDSAISHENEKPVFYKRDVMLTRLVVDKLRIDFVGIDLDYTVYYAGSSKQTIEYPSRWIETRSDNLFFLDKNAWTHASYHVL